MKGEGSHRGVPFDAFRILLATTQRLGHEARRSCAVGTIPLLTRFFRSHELCDGYAATPTHAPSVKFDSSDFMQSLGSEVTCSAVRATQNWNFFDDEQRCTFSVTAGYFPNLEPGFAAVLAAILFAVIPHIQSGYI